MMFSFGKAVIKCPSLSINGIFDDITHDVSGWFVPKIMTKFV